MERSRILSISAEQNIAGSKEKFLSVARSVVTSLAGLMDAFRLQEVTGLASQNVGDTSSELSGNIAELLSSSKDLFGVDLNAVCKLYSKYRWGRYSKEEAR